MIGAIEISVRRVFISVMSPIVWRGIKKVQSALPSIPSDIWTVQGDVDTHPEIPRGRRVLSCESHVGARFESLAVHSAYNAESNYEKRATRNIALRGISR